MRTWKVQMTSYWPLSMALCLTGLGLGNSPLVILSLCSLALSCVLSFFSFFFIFLLFLFALYFSLFITYQKKKTMLDVVSLEGAK